MRGENRRGNLLIKKRLFLNQYLLENFVLVENLLSTHSAGLPCVRGEGIEVYSWTKWVSTPDNYATQQLFTSTAKLRRAQWLKGTQWPGYIDGNYVWHARYGQHQENICGLSTTTSAVFNFSGPQYFHLYVEGSTTMCNYWQGNIWGKCYAILKDSSFWKHHIL